MKKKATVICWISTALAALALCLTCGLPLPAGIPPMLLQWLILPLLALLTAAVQAGRLLAGLRATLAGKPDGRLFCLLAAIGALALAVLGKGGSSAAAAALLLCADAWLEQLQARVDGELPGKRLSSAGARLWFWGFLLAAVCAAVVWGILGAAAIVCRVLGILAVGALCPFSLIAACAVRRTVRTCRVPVLDAQAVPALGDTDIVLLEPESLLTGAPSVSDIRPAGMEEGQFLALAASILQGSGDGQAVCIRALAEDRGLVLRPAAQADAAGAVIDGKHYLAGTAEQLRRAGIPVPRADELALSGKAALCFGMEGGLYLGRIALQRAICADAQETVQALLAQGLSVVLPAGREPLLTRQLAARIGASAAEQGGTAAAWQALKKQGRPALLRAGEPRAELEESGPVLTLETLADAPAVFRVCRRAVRSSRMLTGAAAALAVLLAGCAGGIFAPAADLGGEPLLCALLGLAVAGLTVLPAMAGTPKPTKTE